MDHDNDQERRQQYIDVANDYVAARKLGLDPPEIPEAHLQHPATAWDVMLNWLIANDMVGAHSRWLADHGQAVWCPEWCQSDHGPVQVVDPDDLGVSHDHEPLTIGAVTGVYSMWESADHSQREEHITIRTDRAAGFDGDFLVIPVDAVDQVIEVLQKVPRPD